MASYTPAMNPQTGDRGQTEASQSFFENFRFKLIETFQHMVTAFILLVEIAIPEVFEQLTTMGASKKFDPEMDIPSLEEKVVLVTGGNAGLGKETIRYLSAHSPAKIYLAARTASKAQAAISELRAVVPNAQIEHLPLDLTSFSSIASAVSTFQSQESRLDILINNAGIMATPYSLTKEGYEIQFGTNHVGHALLTKLLLPTLLSTAKQPGSDVRIINVSSLGHRLAPSPGIIFDQPALEKQLTVRRYGQSKLANILFTKELALRYPSITSISIHPGVIITDLYHTLAENFLARIAMRLYSWIAPYLPGHYKDARGGALSQTWAATVGEEELRNGGFYRPIGLLDGGSKWARDEGLAKKLWEWTEEEFGKFGY